MSPLCLPAPELTLALPLAAGNATAAQECVTASSAPEVSTTTILSIAQQFDGYIPSSFFSDLVAFSGPLLANASTNAHNLTQAQLNSELESFFNNSTSYGPAYVTCISQVEKCVLGASRRRARSTPCARARSTGASWRPRPTRGAWCAAACRGTLALRARSATSRSVVAPERAGPRRRRRRRPRQRGFLQRDRALVVRSVLRV